ncbi:hypothetical protein FACS189445_1900 [Spirochaetia bacterium]|nr:hypothetical protein FACS189445_1900 [Spirochaetia bacterium]
MVFWTAAAGANSYIVFYGTEAAGSSQYGGAVSGLSFTISGLQLGTTYYTTVMAGNGAGWSEKSAAVSGRTQDLAVPTGLSATAQSPASMTLSWTPVSGAASYKIYRSDSSSGPFTLVSISTAASCIDTGLSASTQYWYKVSAVSDGGTEGLQSATASGTTSAPSVDPLPGTPGGVSTTVLSSAFINVSWTAVLGATGYMVYYGTETAGSSQYAGTASSSPFAVTGLQPGTTYYFTVKAGNDAGWSAASTPVSGVTTALPVPSGLSATAQSSSGMTISWNAVSGAASYKVYRAGSSAGPFTNISTSSTTTYTDTGLTAGTTYWYKVSAVNGTEGAQSGAVSGITTALAAPTGLSVTAQSSSGMAVSWSAVTGAASYKIYRASSSAGPFTTSVGSSTTTAYTDTGLTAGTTYWYKVSAVNGTEGAQSAAVSGRTSPAAPTGLSATAQSSSGMTLNWSAVTGAASYKIYRASSSAGPFTTSVGSSATTTYTDTGLTAGTTYWYKVSAVNGTEGAQSAAVSWTTHGVATVTTLADSAGEGYADGTSTAGMFYYSSGVAVDNAGNVYVADTYNYRIMKISPSGVVTKLAGSSDRRGYADGTGTAAKFNVPHGVAVDNAGNVYVADSNNNRIRKISSSGVVTTLAGGVYGYADGTGTAAKFYVPTGVAVDNTGNVYVADSNNNRIRKISPSGVVTTLAGDGTYGYADGTGTAAMFNVPNSVAVDNAGNVYVADSRNNRIRKISPNGIVTTLAGNGIEGYADGTGTATQFRYPYGIAVDNADNVYVADSNNNRIRKISPSGVVTTLAGDGTYGYADGTGTAAMFSSPCGVAVDNTGNVYVADTYNFRIRKITQ